MKFDLRLNSIEPIHKNIGNPFLLLLLALLALNVSCAGEGTSPVEALSQGSEDDDETPAVVDSIGTASISFQQSGFQLTGFCTVTGASRYCGYNGTAINMGEGIDMVVRLTGFSGKYGVAIRQGTSTVVDCTTESIIIRKISTVKGDSQNINFAPVRCENGSLSYNSSNQLIGAGASSTLRGECLDGTWNSSSQICSGSSSGVTTPLPTARIAFNPSPAVPSETNGFPAFAGKGITRVSINNINHNNGTSGWGNRRLFVYVRADNGTLGETPYYCGTTELVNLATPWIAGNMKFEIYEATNSDCANFSALLNRRNVDITSYSVSFGTSSTTSTTTTSTSSTTSTTLQQAGSRTVVNFVNNPPLPSPEFAGLGFTRINLTGVCSNATGSCQTSNSSWGNRFMYIFVRSEDGTINQQAFHCGRSNISGLEAAWIDGNMRFEVYEGVPPSTSNCYTGVTFNNLSNKKLINNTSYNISY